MKGFVKTRRVLQIKIDKKRIFGPLSQSNSLQKNKLAVILLKSDGKNLDSSAMFI